MTTPTIFCAALGEALAHSTVNHMCGVRTGADATAIVVLHIAGIHSSWIACRLEAALMLHGLAGCWCTLKPRPARLSHDAACF